MNRLERAVGSALGEPIALTGAASGGSIGAVATARTASGRTLIVKSHPHPPPHMFSCEARGLAWLTVDGGPRTPQVLAVSDHDPAFIALEFIASGPVGVRDEALIGRRLAALHAAGAPQFGLDHDNHLAAVAQSNTPTDTWAEFLADRRIRPFARVAHERGSLPARTVDALDRLADRCADLVGPPEPPARLHGDLWSGNVLVDTAGEPVLIDPAVVGGHREIDLAMMRLFGGFGATVFAAYDEAFPRQQGHEDRVALNQVVPLLIHVMLFGAAYLSRLEAAVGRYVRLR